LRANGNPWFVMIVLINFIHRDAYNLRGKQRKEELGLTYEEALTFADEDLDENWARYQVAFTRGGYP
jgi:hypothetical protein